MAIADNWTKQFGISESDRKVLEKKAHETNSELLRWCLMNGKVPESEYLEWAMQRYQIPSVTGDFFTAPGDSAFWSNVKKDYSWTESFMPVAEWEGVLMIACLEPPQKFNLARPFRLVLASARHLLYLWNSYQQSELQSSPSHPVIEDMPEGLDVSKVSEITDLSGAGARDLTTPTGDEFAMPDGFDAIHAGLSVSKNPEAPSTMAPTLVLDVPTPLANIERPKLSSETANSTATGITRSDATMQLPLPPELPSKSNEFTSDTTENRMEKTSFTISDISTREASSAKDLNELGAIVQARAMKDFSGVMILTFEGSELRPWKWSDYLTTPRNRDIASINLTSPSIFRIVHRTKLPFHGYVSTSEVNKAFFTAFNKAMKFPTNVSVVPVIVDRQWIGMVLAASERTVHYKVALPGLERLAYEFGQRYLSLRKKAA